MNTSIRSDDPPLKRAEAMIFPTPHPENGSSPAATRIPANPPARNMVSGLANSFRIPPWTFHGISELDSPLAG
jgi:hypothetical protein